MRQYAPYVVAEVILDATADEAGNQAFPILAGYIFGKNKGEQEVLDDRAGDPERRTREDGDDRAG